MISSGIAKAEILSLIIANFYKKATDEYYSGGTIEEILNELENKKKMLLRLSKKYLIN